MTGEVEGKSEKVRVRGALAVNHPHPNCSMVLALTFDTEICFSIHEKLLGKSSYNAYFLADVYNQIFLPKPPYIEILVLSLWKSEGRECFALKESR